MPSAYTLNDFEELVRQSKHPRTIYISENDWMRLLNKMNPEARGYDQDGSYVTIITTRVRPQIGILDLSGSKFFED